MLARTASSTRSRLIGLGALTAAAILFSPGGTNAQQLALEGTPKLGAPTVVDEANCGAFRQFALDEVMAHKDSGTLSREWLQSMARFFRAGCRASDAQGPIHITTMTDRDGRSMLIALAQMGSYNIIGISGVRLCHAPTVPGVCPARTGELAPGG